MTAPEQIAAIGYCFGGGVVLAMARSGMDLDAVASFHGMLATQTPAKKGQVQARVLVCHGGADAFVPPEQVEAFKTEMTDAGVDLTFISYPGVKHSFTNPEADEKAKLFGMPVGYDADADRESWQSLLEFLAATWR
jgi:dienelactone hydrolase